MSSCLLLSLSARPYETQRPLFLSDQDPSGAVEPLIYIPPCEVQSAGEIGAVAFNKRATAMHTL